MSRKVFFMISLIALFALTALAAAQPKGDDLGRQSEPKKNPAAPVSARLMPLLPLDNASPIAGREVDFSWSEIDSASRYRLEVEDAHGKAVLNETLPHGAGIYRVPAAKLDAPTNLRWRVVALDRAGKSLAETTWRNLLPISSECEHW